jgi:hypothetical protein
MLRLAEAVAHEVGDPGEKRIARSALIAGWAQIAEQSLPFTPRGLAEVDLSEKGWALAKAGAALDTAVSLQIAHAVDGAPPEARRISDDYQSPIDAPPVVQGRVGPAVVAYHKAALPNLMRILGNRPELVSPARIIASCRFHIDQVTVGSLDALSAGLASMHEAEPSSFAAEIADCMEALFSYRDALKAYEAAHAEARRRGEVIANALAPTRR